MPDPSTPCGRVSPEGKPAAVFYPFGHPMPYAYMRPPWQFKQADEPRFSFVAIEASSRQAKPGFPFVVERTAENSRAVGTLGRIVLILRKIFSNETRLLIIFIGSIDALQAAIPGLAVRVVQGWPPTGHRVVWHGSTLEILSRLNPTIAGFLPTVRRRPGHRTVVALTTGH
jgi:hypothetical protein